MEDDDLEDDEFLSDIAPDVLGVLGRDRFFERLDDLFFPVDASREPVRCDGSFARSIEILRQLGFDPLEIEEVTAVLHSRGACCDCEVLYNVAEESRLRSNYWQAQYLKAKARSESNGDPDQKRKHH